MKTSELVFIGIRGFVVALNRATGEQLWATQLRGYDFVNVVLQDGLVFATSHGEAFCLEPLTGKLLWHNRLKGFGLGLATIAADGAVQAGGLSLMAEKRRRDQAAAAGGAGAATC
jgi:hypothetical protein